jgi:uncharacterized membrane protein (UPF0127 family)
MPSYRQITNANGDVLLRRARWVESFWDHFVGLQFAAPLPTDEGLLFVSQYEGQSHTAIHMFFVSFDIAVIWLDKDGVVVDQCLARSWRPFYAPSAPAQYFIEAHPSLLERVKVGERLRFDQGAA